MQESYWWLCSSLYSALKEDVKGQMSYAVMLKHNSAFSPGFADDVTLEEAQLRLSPGAEH